jgi:DNA-directed RNA polymerase specialized sigma subunit
MTRPYHWSDAGREARRAARAATLAARYAERNLAIVAFYQEPHSLRETGQRFGIGPMQVSRILASAGIERHPAHLPVWKRS